MRREPALQPLSHDHQHALAVALKLTRADADSMADVQAAFLRFWRAEGREHFRVEEELLLPAYAEYGDATDPLVARVLMDHLLIRRRAAAMERGTQQPLPVLHELGVQLSDHVRLEERQLFPLIEKALPPRELDRLGAALAAAGGDAG